MSNTVAWPSVTSGRNVSVGPSTVVGWLGWRDEAVGQQRITRRLNRAWQWGGRTEQGEHWWWAERDSLHIQGAHEGNNASCGNIKRLEQRWNDKILSPTYLCSNLLFQLCLCRITARIIYTANYNISSVIPMSLPLKKITAVLSTLDIIYT